MAMVSVASATIISDICLKLRDFLQNNVTDPISATRSQSQWIYTAYQEMNIEYPIVTVTHTGFRDEHTAIGSEFKTDYIVIRIQVWSKSTKQRNEIWDEIYDELRHHYTTADANGDSITGLGLHDMILLFANDMDEAAPSGEGHIHRKIADFQMTYYAMS